VISAFLLAALLTGSRPGAVGLETCPFPERLLPYRVRHAKTGELIRSSEAIREFKKCTGFINGRPGYVIDHIFPLACGGPDVPENLIWQLASDGKLKDKWERVRPGCGSKKHDEPGEKEASGG
jgi:hypothetical protein